MQSISKSKDKVGIDIQKLYDKIDLIQGGAFDLKNSIIYIIISMLAIFSQHIHFYNWVNIYILD